MNAQTVRPTYVIGHKNPDTDSIASAIAYTYLKQQKEPQEKFIAARCGNISSETQYVLDRFGVQPPRFIGDVRTQVRDMEMRRISGVPRLVLTGVAVVENAGHNEVGSTVVETLELEVQSLDPVGACKGELEGMDAFA